jgi:hypothetical protein
MGVEPTWVKRSTRRAVVSCPAAVTDFSHLSQVIKERPGIVPAKRNKTDRHD